MTVSVVIPCYNAAPYLGEAIQGVLDQTAAVDEVVVVDDGSTDSSVSVATAFGGKVRVIYQSNSGPSTARNRGVAEAAGDVIVFLDADDRMDPSCVVSRLELLGDPSCAMVVGAYNLVDASGARVGSPQQVSENLEITREEALRRMSCPTLGLAIRRSAFLEVGGFDESLRIGEDSDLLLRLLAVGRCLVDPVPHADYRMLGGSLSRDYVLWFDSYKKVYAKNGGSWASFANLTCDRVFGKILKDGAGFGGMLAVIGKRPALAGYFVIWLFRAVWNRVLWMFGGGPLRRKP